MGIGELAAATGTTTKTLRRNACWCGGGTDLQEAKPALGLMGV